MTKPPLKLSENLVETIEDRIATGAYPPGTRLDEVELASAFGVSRTPIREALIQLAVTRMIEKRSRKGFVVAELSPERMCDMFEVMAELEAMCGRFAARRANPFLQQKILQAHEACRGVEDTDLYYRLNERFHASIFEASQNSFLTEEALSVQRLLRPYRRLQLRVKERLPTSFDEHQGIVDAILAGNGELAAERLRAHVMVQGVRYTDLIASIEKFSANDAGKPAAHSAPKSARN